MTKAKLEIDITDEGYSFAELALSNDTNLSFGFDNTEGGLTVYRQEWDPFVQTVADISPKKLRKFARALLALADQVDPPAPRVEYFATTYGFLYRQRAGKHLEVWSVGAWKQSVFPTIVAQQKNNGESDSWPITVEELPLAARPA